MQTSWQQLPWVVYNQAPQGHSEGRGAHPKTLAMCTFRHALGHELSDRTLAASVTERDRSENVRYHEH